MNPGEALEHHHNHQRWLDEDHDLEAVNLGMIKGGFILVILCLGSMSCSAACQMNEVHMEFSVGET